MLMTNGHIKHTLSSTEPTLLQAANQLIELLLAQAQWEQNTPNNKIEITHDEHN